MGSDIAYRSERARLRPLVGNVGDGPKSDANVSVVHLCGAQRIARPQAAPMVPHSLTASADCV
ncbi:MAG: hypothetical protein CMM49_10830 [Rhodospirillaceae bacterium]|nr:hypothetical protein [Rhodospirillaceae bacterium]